MQICKASWKSVFRMSFVKESEKELYMSSGG